MVRALEEISLIEVRNERQIGAQEESLAQFTSVRALSAGTGVLSVGTRAQRPGSAALNDEFFEQDTLWRYRWTGTAWAYTSGVNTGTNAARAAITVTASDNGAWFYATDTKLLWRVSAGAWAQSDITPAAHKDLHKSGGTDAFTSSDLLEAIVKRLQESAGPTTLTLGAITDGEFLKRSGTTIISGAPSSAITNEAGQAVLASVFTLNAASGTYQDTGLSVTLPSAGTYIVTADVRGGLNFTGTAPSYIVAKLYNSTDAAYIADTETLILYAETTTIHHQACSTITIVVTVAASKVIKLYAARFHSGTPSNTFIYSDTGAGRTRLSYLKVA